MTIPLYPGVAGSPATVTTDVYIAGTSPTIVVSDASVLGGAPNVVTLTSGTTPDAEFVSVVYTTKNGNVLSGLTVVEGLPGTTFAPGTIAQRLWTAWDWQRIIDKFDGTAVDPKLLTSENDLNGVVIPGIYYWVYPSSPANRPYEMYSGTMVVMSSGFQVFQIVYGDDDRDVTIYAMRSITNGSAGNWGYLPFGNDTRGIVNIGCGGTGASNANEARANLGAADAQHAAQHAAGGADPIPMATTTTPGLESAADKSKLDAIAPHADANVLEGIQIGGVAAPISSKQINIPPASASELGVVKAGAGLSIGSDGTIAVKNALKPIYGIRVDWTDDNPSTWFTYTRESKNMAPADGSAATPDFVGTWNKSWLFSDEYRYWVVLHNIASATAAGDASLVGTENYRLNPSNIFQKLDGTAANLDGTDGDVMVCFKHYWQTYRDDVDNGEFLFSPEDLGDEWEARAFEFDGTIRDRVYVGVFQATLDSNDRLRSIYNGTAGPLTNVSIVNADTYARNNNAAGVTGYSQWNYNLYDLILRRFWLKYRNSDSQAKLGYGYCNASTTDPQPDIVGGSITAYDSTAENPYIYGGNPTGYDWGLVAGTNAGGMPHYKTHCRFDGIDDLWGNTATWCKGVACAAGSGYGDTNHHLRFAPGNADIPSLGTTSWRHLRTDVTANASGYIGKLARGIVEPCAPVSFAGGASNKYFCDYGGLTAGRVANSGGAWAATAYAGVSRLTVYTSLSYPYASIGARLLKYSDIIAD